MLIEHILPVTRKRFARMVLRQTQRALPGTALELSESEFFIRIGPTGNGSVFYLENIFQEYKRASILFRPKLLAHFMTMFTNTLNTPGSYKTLEDAKPFLLPRVRDAAYHHNLKLATELYHKDSETPDTPTVAMNQELTLELVIDAPQIIMSLNRESLETWQMSFDELLTIARDNLWSKSNEPWQELQPGLFRSPWRDNHDASRLFLHDLIWQLPVKGRHVAFIPDRDTLLVTGSDDAAGLSHAADICTELLQAERRISGIPFILDGKDWKVFDIPQTHPAYDSVRISILYTNMLNYEGQKDLLRAIYEKNGIDVFVASVFLKEIEGCVMGFAAWSENTETLLPRTEQIIFAAGDGETVHPLGHVPWERVVKIVGHRMQPQGIFPERWRVTSFPSENELKALGPVALPAE